MCAHVYVCVCACVCVFAWDRQRAKKYNLYKSVLLSSKFKFPENVTSFREFITLLGIDPGVYSGERERERKRERKRGRKIQIHCKFGMVKPINSNEYGKVCWISAMKWGNTCTNTGHQCTGAPHSNRCLLLHGTIKFCYDQNSSSKVQCTHKCNKHYVSSLTIHGQVQNKLLLTS